MFEKLDEEARAFIFKVIVPALVAVSIKLAVMVKTEKSVSLFQAITSIVTGIGSAYLSAPIVISYTTPNSMPLVIAAIAISGEKIGYFFIYKFRVEEVFKDMLSKYIRK
jgi:hypothetical protein